MISRQQKPPPLPPIPFLCDHVISRQQKPSPIPPLSRPLPSFAVGAALLRCRQGTGMSTCLFPLSFSPFCCCCCSSSFSSSSFLLFFFFSFSFSFLIFLFSIPFFLSFFFSLFFLSFFSLFFFSLFFVFYFFAKKYSRVDACKDEAESLCQGRVCDAYEPWAGTQTPYPHPNPLPFTLT